MSDQKRILKCSTPMELYNFINDLDDDTGFIVPFMDRADLYLNGCACAAEENWEQMVHEYKLLVQFDFSSIKEKLKCDSIILLLDGVSIGTV